METSTITEKFQNPFWRLNIGHIISIVAFSVVTLVAYGRLAERFDNVVTTQSRQELKIQSMDDGGTNASRRRVDLEQAAVDSHEKRLQKTEEVIGDIKVMKEKIDRISDDVKELKNKPK